MLDFIAEYRKRFLPHLGTCQKLAGGGGGVETEGGSQLFETAEKEGVVKNGPLKGEGHANMCP